ncbi:MAG: hypothetical protein IPI93_06025 [Sphingobacteriaceae bacterium]|nr:hypothetical protein [Sphingobacteriaceae bacterium]
MKFTESKEDQMSQFILIPQEKFEQLNQKVDRLVAFHEQKDETPIRMDDWIPESFAQKLLGLKTTSLWALRKKRKITSSKIGAKIFYSVKSIEKLLNKNQE